MGTFFGACAHARGLDRGPNLHLSILHACILLLLADQHLPACRCSRMPRFNGGIGRTGKKHKKVPKFNVHRQEKGDCGPKTLDAPATADPPVQSAVEDDSEGHGVPLRSRLTSRCAQQLLDA